MLIFLIISCDTREYQNYTTKLENEISYICLNDKNFIPYSSVKKSDCGNQIGIVDYDQNDKIYEYKGYSSDEWIINCYSDMGDTFMLLRELNTTDIPEGLESEYIWNN